MIEAAKQDERKCWCPLRPYFSPGSMGSGSVTEQRALERWQAEHAHHPYAKARDELARGIQSAEGTMGSGEAALRMVYESMGIPVAEISGQALTEVEEAEREVKAASFRIRAAEDHHGAAYRKLQDAAARERAKSFQPNATMTQHYLGLFSMNATHVDPIIPKGARVQVEPGQFQGDLCNVTRDDGRRYELGEVYFQMDEGK
jgi:hypothetical protein